MAVYDTFADWEVGFATAHINNGARQRDHGPPGRHRRREPWEPVTSMGGMRVIPDVTLDELRPADSAMLILPGAETRPTGGYSASAAKARKSSTPACRSRRFAERRWGSPSRACSTSATTRATRPWSSRPRATAARPNYRDEPAVTDAGRDHDGDGPVEFAREVMAPSTSTAGWWCWPRGRSCMASTIPPGTSSSWPSRRDQEQELLSGAGMDDLLVERPVPGSPRNWPGPRG